MVVQTDDFCDLTLHVLAHVPLAEAANLHDPRYVRWAGEALPAAQQERLTEGAAALARQWRSGSPPMVHAWPQLWGSIDELLSVAAPELRALRPDHVRNPGVLAAVRTAPGAELLHATICALAPDYTQWRAEQLQALYEDALAQVEPWFAEAAALLPALGEARVELAMALGARGRAFTTRIVVGAPAPWNGLDGRTAAVLAMHEHSVHKSGQSGYVAAEWAALRSLARLMVRASKPLAQAHARWLGGLGLRPLLDALVSRGQLDPAQRDHLASPTEDRVDRLAALADR